MLLRRGQRLTTWRQRRATAPLEPEDQAAGEAKAEAEARTMRLGLRDKGPVASLLEDEAAGEAEAEVELVATK